MNLKILNNMTSLDFQSVTTISNKNGNGDQVSLHKGWNLVAIPTNNGESKTVAEFFGNNIIGFVWAWKAASHQFEIVSEHLISNRIGYWVFSHSRIDL